MRLVLDTNVVVSAVASRSFTWEVQAHALLNHRVISSELLLREIESVLVRKLEYPPLRAEDLARRLRSVIEVVAPVPLPAPACRDPADDVVLGTALAGSCELIITGDKDLLALGNYGSVRIMTPRAFWLNEGLDRGR